MKSQAVTKDEILIIILSRSYSTGLSVARSLGKAGYTVDMIATSYKAGASEVASRSKYIRNYSEVVSKKVKGGIDNNLVEQIMTYTEEAKSKKIILFPTDDYTTSVIDLMQDEFEKYFLMPHIVDGLPGSITHMMNKVVQSEIAKKAGLNVPEEWIIPLDDEIVIPQNMVYPCFCKPIESVTGYKKEMATCQDEEELLHHLKKLKKKHSKRSILVQEFLNIENEIDFSGVCLDQNVIVPAIIRKTHVAQHEKGVTMAGVIAPFDELGDTTGKIIDTLKEFHYIGMFDMELNVVGGKLYFNEINLRSGGPNYSYFQSGVNLPELVVKELVGLEHSKDEECVKSYGKSFIYEKVAWEDYYFKFISKKKLNKLISSSDITLLDDADDPEPYALFKKLQKMKLLIRPLKSTKRFLKNIRKKIRKAFRRIFNFFFNLAKKAAPFIFSYPQAKKNFIPRSDDHNTVIVAGRNYCSNLTVAKSFGMAGYRVEVLHIFNMKKGRAITRYLKTPLPDAYSKYVQAFHVCITRKKTKYIVEKLLLLADPERKILIVPADDLVASVIDKNYEELSEYFILPNINSTAGEINRLMSKGLQKDLAESFGIPVINGHVIEVNRVYSEPVFEISESISFPCFIKPNVSVTSSKSKMCICNDIDELTDKIRTFSRRKKYSVMVEELVDIKNEYSILGVCAGDTVCAPCFFIAEEGGEDERRGVAVTGRTLDPSLIQPLKEKLDRFVASLGFTGLFDIDLIEDKQGNMYFAEINMRVGASCYAFTQSGINTPAMLADYIFDGKPLDTKCKNEMPNKTFVSEKGVFEEYKKKLISRKEAFALIDSTDIQFIKDSNDPKPFKKFSKAF